jgi:hypothetical protein
VGVNLFWLTWVGRHDITWNRFLYVYSSYDQYYELGCLLLNWWENPQQASNYDGSPKLDVYMLYSEPGWRMSQNYSLANACPQNEFYIRKPTQTETFKSPSVVAVCFLHPPPSKFEGYHLPVPECFECRSNRVLCIFLPRLWISIMKPTWCTFNSVYWESRASTCFEHYLLILRRRCINSTLYVASV